MIGKHGCLVLACLFYLFAGKSPLSSQVFPVKDIVLSGDRVTHLNIVFLSEGYTIDEMSQFHQDVLNAASYLLGTSPYKEYEFFFNVFAIEVPSRESGTDHPAIAFDEPAGLDTFSRDTYFNSTFDYNRIHRLLVVQNKEAVYSVLQDNFPDWDIALIIVNHEWDGGSGGAFPTFSLGPLSPEILVHEMGHSFARLADEFETGGLPGHEAPNAIAETTRDSIRWNRWIDDSTPIPTPEESAYDDVVGLFEGAVYNSTGWYRPKLNCKMRQLGIPFCEICSEQTILSLYNWVNTIRGYEPLDTLLTAPQDTLLDLVVERMQTAHSTVRTEWYIDGQPVAMGSDTLHFDASSFHVGYHVIKAIVADTTDLVRNDPEGLLTSSVTWKILVESSQRVEDHPGGLPNQFYLGQNTPNPFNSTTTISYHLPRAGSVRLAITNISGQIVETLVNEHQGPGSYLVTWNATEFASGLYFYRIQAGEYSAVKKCLLIR